MHSAGIFAGPFFLLLKKKFKKDSAKLAAIYDSIKVWKSNLIAVIADLFLQKTLSTWDII